MRTKAGYWIGGGLIALGVVAAVAWAVLGLARIDDTVADFARVPVPGSRTMALDAGKHVIYVEGPRADEGAPPISVVVVDARTARPLAIATYEGSLTYSFGSAGSAIATVTTPSAGRYVVRATSSTVRGHRLAIGDSIAGRIVATILGAFAVGGGCALAGTAFVAATAIRRSRRHAADPPDPFGR